MPRIRTIKPEISFHERLFDLEQETGLPIRFVWSVLPCHCDREGRFEYRVRALKAQILPYDDVDFSRVLDALHTREFIEKYEENGRIYGWIPSFLRHQVVNNRESESVLPKPNKNNILTRDLDYIDALMTREPRVQQGKEGKGKEGKGEPSEEKSSDSKKQTLKNYIEFCNSKSVKPIPIDSVVFKNAKKLNLSDEFVMIAWELFKEYFLLTKPRTVKSDWVLAFNNCLKDNGYGAYARNSQGEWYLTTKGKNTLDLMESSDD